ncbi:heavy-metal-associated domain-containing protein [Crenothrix polyspora]|uniref:Copper chaperone n=1 Tax=Crenothrix polyspora TaxID=360316 RepID=A0A1R4HKX3_9GAMM|nr:heavy-metal-associated domain-containing protein [Crenothrix polyspora]SJM96540.1 Copper chaperone [Crenothrix polyspora]
MIESVVLSVLGMKCGGCESNITTKLSAVDGVKTVQASSKDKTVSVEFESDKTSLETIKSVIQAAGYSVQ